MFIFSHLHQLFNAEACQSYIHTLRWKDRPLQFLGVRATTLVLGVPTTTSPA